MSSSIAISDTPLCIRGFESATEVLLIALPDTAIPVEDHSLSFHYDPSRDLLEVVLTLRPGGARFIIHLPGVQSLPPDAVALIPADIAETIAPLRPETDTATLTGTGLYPVRSTDRARAGVATRMRFRHQHDWRRDGPPPERFFDLSNPASRIEIRLDPTGGGPIYAIRFTEQAGHGSVTDTHSSIVLVQTAPDSPRLSSGALAQWFATRLGTPAMRAIAWIWLGNAGSYPDEKTGARQRFGQINQSPQLSLSGPIAGSVEIRK